MPTGVGDFRDMDKVKGHGQEKHKDGDGEVNPLYVVERALVGELEEDVGAEDGRDDGADAIEGLRDVDADLRVARRAAHWTPPLARGLQPRPTA